MRWIRNAGPIVLASLSTMGACWGISHAWPRPLIAFLLFFASCLAAISCIERGLAVLIERFRKSTTES